MPAFALWRERGSKLVSVRPYRDLVGRQMRCCSNCHSNQGILDGDQRVVSMPLLSDWAEYTGSREEPIEQGYMARNKSLGLHDDNRNSCAAQVLSMFPFMS